MDKTMFRFTLQSLNKIYKGDYAYYRYDKNCVIINLFNLTEIDNIPQLIQHEYLHAAIWECRKNIEHKIIYDFFEEKIIADILGEKFDEENYYEYVQIEE